MNSRHRQRGSPPHSWPERYAAPMGLEDTVLFLIAQAGVEREHLGMTQIRVTQLLADLPDVAFPGKEYQDIAGGPLPWSRS